ncbi:uncharacterized protein LOC134190818 isoform X2 [Corticium candelabrum]|uniref:uncharacterized protein LOC134190818 isoform X2 n=1 Tax=Corticium candelabrum TaxID=121492 RepID=UPI002E254392|nr:uncharacterized protein LOC134190818 isoform X2 [Corticium candelabrum]
MFIIFGWYTHVRGHRSLWHLLHNDEPNLLRYLKKAGYTVNWWGKNDLLAADSFNSSVSSAMHMGGPQNGGNSFRFGEAGYYSFLSNAYNGNWNETSDYNNVAEAVKFLETKPTKPFMIYLPLIKPHPPYSAPEPFHSLIDPKDIPDLRPWGLDKKPDYHELIRKHRNLTSLDVDFFKKLQAVYMGSISYSDHLFGILLKALEDNGYADSTAVFVFADHGDYAGDYGLVEKWPSGLEDVLTRVPLLVRVPGGASNHVVREQVQHMDIVATILHLANVTAQHVHFSEDLTPILMGGFGDVDRAVYSEGGYSTHEPLDFEGRCKDPEQSGKCNPQQIYYPKGLQQQMEPLSVCRSVMIRTLTHKLVLRSDPKDFDHCSELYDLQKDPRYFTVFPTVYLYKFNLCLAKFYMHVGN